VLRRKQYVQVHGVNTSHYYSNLTKQWFAVDGIAWKNSNFFLNPLTLVYSSLEAGTNHISCYVLSDMYTYLSPVHVSFCFAIPYVTQTTYMTSNNPNTLSNELEGCGRKRSWPHLRHYSGNLFQVIRKNMHVLRIVSILAEIKTQHLPSTNLKRRGPSQLTWRWPCHKGVC
jgi:hypothetical protein